MQEQLKQIESNAIEEIGISKTIQELNDVRVKFLGKKGELTCVLRGMGALSPCFPFAM